ncbi:Hypothetical predicted protein [Marmota monax]|uniref:Uncharacterized protein n=1 Tax=Marmota monax TaxID=9995 RepID=A0A5E4AS47_MARMO|nr:hypothetical protein GHT09_009314 [Marmota monax]VTJ59586.1 Hypothetical predicted protein [Marmota monax]
MWTSGFGVSDTCYQVAAPPWVPEEEQFPAEGWSLHVMWPVDSAQLDERLKTDSSVGTHLPECSGSEQPLYQGGHGGEADPTHPLGLGILFVTTFSKYK